VPISGSLLKCVEQALALRRSLLEDATPMPCGSERRSGWHPRAGGESSAVLSPIARAATEGREEAADRSPKICNRRLARRPSIASSRARARSRRPRGDAAHKTRSPGWARRPSPNWPSGSNGLQFSSRTTALLRPVSRPRETGGRSANLRRQTRLNAFAYTCGFSSRSGGRRGACGQWSTPTNAIWSGQTQFRDHGLDQPRIASLQ